MGVPVFTKNWDTHILRWYRFLAWSLCAWWDNIYHGRRNFKDTNPFMSFSLVILFGVVK